MDWVYVTVVLETSTISLTQKGQDKEIVKIVLLLTGAVEGAKSHVHDYITTFDQFNYLWQNDKQKEYEKFMKSGPEGTAPDLESFSAELKKYMEVERQIRDIPSVHIIGCMCLDSSPLMDSLISEAVTWKAQYGRNMYEEAKAQLMKIQDYFKDKTRAMNRDFGQETELEEVRDVMLRELLTLAFLRRELLTNAYLSGS